MDLPPNAKSHETQQNLHGMAQLMMAATLHDPAISPIQGATLRWGYTPFFSFVFVPLQPKSFLIPGAFSRLFLWLHVAQKIRSHFFVP